MAATVRDALDLPQMQTKCLKFLSTGNSQVQKCVQILRDYGRTPKSKRKVVGFFDMEGTKLKAPYSASLVASGFDETWIMNWIMKDGVRATFADFMVRPMNPEP